VSPVEEAKSSRDRLDVVEGMQFRPRLHLAYSSQRRQMRVEMDDAYIPHQREKLSS